MLKLRKIAFVLSLMAAPFAANATVADTTAAIMQYEDCLYLNNIAYGNINPTFIKDLPIEAFATLEVGYNAGKGDFHKIDKSGKVRDLLVSVYGVRKLRDVSFEGGMSYSNGNDYARCWNATLFQAPQNPFILADSIKSDYTTEQFALDGRFSWEPIDLMRFGVNAFYEVGSMSDEQDPRLETKGMRFTINPGFDFKVSDFVKIGVTGGIRLFNEDSHYNTVETGVTSSFFQMSGMGTFRLEAGSAFNREVKGMAYFADLQVYWQRPGYGNFLNIGFERNTERAEDKIQSSVFIGGEYSNTQISGNERFSFTKGKFVHNFELDATMESIEGIWFHQKPVMNEAGTSSDYKVMSEEVKHKESLMSGNFRYRMDMLADSKQPSLTVGAEANFVNSDTKNYPDVYFQKYTNVKAGAFIKKYFTIKKSILSLSARGGYKMNLSNSINMASSEKLRDCYTYPMFDYLTADYYDVAGQIEVKIPVVAKRFTSYIGVFAEASTQQYVGDEASFKSTHFNNFGGGVSYTF